MWHMENLNIENVMRLFMWDLRFIKLGKVVWIITLLVVWVIILLISSAFQITALSMDSIITNVLVQYNRGFREGV